MQTIKLNLIPQGVNPTCYSSQYDTGRVIRVLLFEGVTPYTLSNSESVSLSVRKPDNTLVTTSVTNTEAEYVDIVTTEQMTAVTGVNICELKISEGSKVIGSLNFNMQVELDPTAHGIPSGSALDNLQEQVDTCVENSLERLYDGSSVSFDSEPTASHNAPYTVTSAGIKTALDTKANSSDLNNYYNKTQVDNALANLTASDIGYDNTNTGLTSDKVQGAIDEVLAQVPLNATGLSYSNTQSGLQSNNVQGAIDELAGESTDVSYTSNQNSGNKIGDITIDGVTTSLYTGEISSVGTLDDLNDVTITTPTNGEILVYNNGVWENQANPASTTNFAPDYDDTATYNTNDKVIYQGLLYVCLEDSVTGAWDGTKWQQISVADLNAELLPIQSGIATNTKDYIDTGLSGKADTGDLALKQNKAILHIKKEFANTYTIQTCIGALINEFGKNTMAFGFVLTGSGWYEGMMSFYDGNQGGGYLIMNGGTPRLWAISYQNGTVNVTEK